MIPCEAFVPHLCNFPLNFLPLDCILFLPKYFCHLSVVEQFLFSPLVSVNDNIPSKDQMEEKSCVRDNFEYLFIAKILFVL